MHRTDDYGPDKNTPILRQTPEAAGAWLRRHGYKLSLTMLFYGRDWAGRRETAVEMRCMGRVF